MQKRTRLAGRLRRALTYVLYALFFLLLVSVALALASELKGYGNLTIPNVLYLLALVACCALNADVRRSMFSAKHALPSSLIALGLTVVSALRGPLMDAAADAVEDLSLIWMETAVTPMLLLQFVAAFFLCKGLFAFFSHMAERSVPAPRSALADDGARRAFWLSFLSCFVSLTLFWLNVVFPYVSGPDTSNQLQQIHGELRLLDLHTPTHTLLLMGLTRIVDDLGFVVVVQIVLVSVTFGFFGRSLCRRRHAPLYLYAWACAFLPLLTDAAYGYTAPWKDTPYTLCIAAQTYLLMRLSEEDFPLTLPRAIAFGVTGAFMFLFRYNGLVPLAAGAVFFTVYAARRRYWKQLASFALTLLVVIGGMQAVIYGLAGFERRKNGFAVQTFLFGIASVVMEDGDITDEELDEVDALLGLDWIEAQYNKSLPRTLIWEKENWENDLDGFFDDPNHEPYNNLMVVSAGERPLEVVSLYLRLLPRNLGICVTALMNGLPGMWFFNGIFSHVFLLVALVIAAAVCWTRKTLARRWAVFLPLAANLISVAVSTITNEFRYLLPTYLLFVPLLVYILTTADMPREDSLIP